MTNHEFENYLTLVSRLLRLSRGQREQIGHELRDHLELRVAEMVESGMEPFEATRTALEEFGDASALAHQFQTISHSYRRRWVMRFATFSIAGCFLVAILVMSMWPTNTRFGAPDSSLAQDAGRSTPLATTPQWVPDQGVQMSDTSRRNRMTQVALEKTVDNQFQFDETPFEEVIDFLNEKFDLTTILDQSAMDDALPRDEPVSFHISNIPLKTALRLMLRKHNATYVVQDGVLKIISMDIADDPVFFSRKIFDCRDLIQQIKVAEKDRIGLRRGSHGFGGGKGGGGFGGGGGVFSLQAAGLPPGPTESANTGSQEETLKEILNLLKNMSARRQNPAPATELITAESLLTDLIQSLVDPDDWADTSGEASIDMIGGLVVVVAREEMLDKVNDLLQDLQFQLKTKQPK